jgi:hypothetical protein
VTGVVGVARAAVGAAVEAVGSALAARTARNAAVAIGEKVSAIGLTKAETEATRVFFKSEGKELGSLTKDALLKYRGAAEDALSGEGGKKVSETVVRVQSQRIQWIDDALKRM